MNCPRCMEERQLTHRVKSEELDLLVCYQCGIDAEIAQGAAGTAGGMTIQLVETKFPRPIFFSCGVCHARFPTKLAYADHWWRDHD